MVQARTVYILIEQKYMFLNGKQVSAPFLILNWDLLLRVDRKYIMEQIRSSEYILGY